MRHPTTTPTLTPNENLQCNLIGCHCLLSLRRQQIATLRLKDAMEKCKLQPDELRQIYGKKLVARFKAENISPFKEPQAGSHKGKP